MIVAVDSLSNVEGLAEAAADHGVRPRVVIEVDCGLARAGVAPGDPCLTLARAIIAHPALRFAGLMTWEGHTAGISDPAEKSRAVRDSLGP